MSGNLLLKDIPSVDKLLVSEELEPVVDAHGHTRVRETIRELLDQIRSDLLDGNSSEVPSIQALSDEVSERITRKNHGTLTQVINLTGTVLHTNLGRAVLPVNALDAIATVAGANSNLEFDLASGKRGDRDTHIEALLAELTGAEAVTVVNNNAAAVLLSLNTLAAGKEVCISRGELVEIGGSFRIPEVMEKSNCRLREVGATNRTHLKDYRNAITDQTGLLLKVHTSNYEIRGFTQEVSYREVSELAGETGLPFMADLGSGTLVDLEQYGLEHEPTVQEVLAAGADIVTFSGDKLLGGPQAGIIAGKKVYVDAIKKNPLKRALRVDKMTITALTEVLKLYLEPETLAERLPTLRHLSRPAGDIETIARQVEPHLTKFFKDVASIDVVDTHSQIGSGALPLDQIPSFAIAITPVANSDAALQAISKAFRELPIPVIGRLSDGQMMLDCRTLDDPGEFIRQLEQLQQDHLALHPDH